MASDQPHGLEGPEDGQDAVQGHVRTEGDGMDLLAHWTLWENSRGDLKVDGPHLAKTPGRDGIGYVEPVKVVRADALEGAVEASEVERLADAIERDKREPDKVLCHLALLRRLVLEARLAEASS